MEYLIIFGIIFTLLLLGLLTKVVKGFLKGFFLVSLVFTLIAGAFTYSVYTDAIAFQKGWESDSKLFLLHDQGYLVSGYMSEPGNPESPITPVSTSVIKGYRETFSDGDYDTILGDNYKLFLIDLAAFSEVKEVEFGDTKLTLEQVKQLLESESPSKDFAKLTMGIDLPVEIDAEQDENFRSAVFAGLFATAIKDQGPLYIVKKVKDNGIQVHPETALFKTIKLIPLTFIKHAFAQVAETGAQGITAAVTFIGEVIDENKGDIIGILR